MHAYNSDGYILIDMKEADITQSSQYIPGIYNRIVEEVTKANKLAVVINAGKLTPMAAAINKMLNYYVITTSLYIFKVNSNDIVIIEQAGGSTVEVSIVPTLLSGTKIADFAIGDQEGSLYAPTQQTEINDSVKSDHLTWSSDKIDTLLGGKANTADLATVATTGSYTDLSNTPTIPTKVSELQNDSGYITDSALTSYQPKTDNSLATTSKEVVGAINELKSGKQDSITFYTRTNISQPVGTAHWSISVPQKTGYSRFVIGANPSTAEIEYIRFVEDGNNIRIYMNNSSTSSVTYNLTIAVVYKPN